MGEARVSRCESLFMLIGDCGDRRIRGGWCAPRVTASSDELSPD